MTALYPLPFNFLLHYLVNCNYHNSVFKTWYLGSWDSFFVGKFQISSSQNCGLLTVQTLVSSISRAGLQFGNAHHDNDPRKYQLKQRLSRNDGKCSDGLTLIPWQGVQPLPRDVTVVSVLETHSYISATALRRVQLWSWRQSTERKLPALHFKAETIGLRLWARSACQRWIYRWIWVAD